MLNMSFFVPYLPDLTVTWKLKLSEIKFNSDVEDLNLTGI